LELALPALGGADSHLLGEPDSSADVDRLAVSSRAA
jgi:hypothetical protein